MHRPLALLLLLALAACGGRVTTLPTTPVVSGPAPAHHVAMLAAVNEARATPTTCGTESLPAALPLALDARLSTAAQLHTEEMRRLGRISHTGADGSSVAERVSRHAYDWRSVGENVASGFPSPEVVVQAWLASPGHCRNVVAADYVHLGVGHDDGFWTQVFARPR
jgi:uncharacterized protein YkwD